MAYDLTQRFTPVRDNQPDMLGPEEFTRDYVVYDCVVFDGQCNCPRNPEGGVHNTCKYLNQVR